MIRTKMIFLFGIFMLPFMVCSEECFILDSLQNLKDTMLVDVCDGKEVPENQESIWYCKKDLNKYEICEGDVWYIQGYDDISFPEDLERHKVEVTRVLGKHFRMKHKSKDSLSFELYCAGNNKPTICGKLLKKGKGKCISIRCE